MLMGEVIQWAEARQCMEFMKMKHSHFVTTTQASKYGAMREPSKPVNQ